MENGALTWYKNSHWTATLILNISSSNLFRWKDSSWLQSTQVTVEILYKVAVEEMAVAFFPPLLWGCLFCRAPHFGALCFCTSTVYMLAVLSHNFQQCLRDAGDPISTLRVT